MRFVSDESENSWAGRKTINQYQSINQSIKLLNGRPCPVSTHHDRRSTRSKSCQLWRCLNQSRNTAKEWDHEARLWVSRGLPIQIKMSFLHQSLNSCTPCWQGSVGVKSLWKSSTFCHILRQWFGLCCYQWQDKATKAGIADLCCKVFDSKLRTDPNSESSWPLCIRLNGWGDRYSPVYLEVVMHKGWHSTASKHLSWCVHNPDLE
jgi:hypothetical protein